MTREQALREKLIRLGIITPNAHPVKDVVCGQCSVVFQVLEEYHERFCGYCQFPKRRYDGGNTKPVATAPVITPKGPNANTH